MTTDADVHEAKVSSRKSFSSIWIVPIVALLIGLWMLYFHWSNQGPLIQIQFETASGIEAGKTKIKARNVELGIVEDVLLAEDSSGVTIIARIDNHGRHLLKENTSIWVVRPRIGAGGISGLNTLLSGAYIEMQAGTGDADTTTEFVGLEVPPVTPIGTAGLHVTLRSRSDRALPVGAEIYYHGLVAGRIEYIHFNSSERATYYNAFVEAPYHELITSNTRFWYNSGLSLELSADGVRAEVANLQTLLGGGVSFDVPENLPQGDLITARAEFEIFPRKSSIRDKQYTHALQYVVLAGESIRGLRLGAPVEYKGIRVGEVIRTDIEYEDTSNLLDANAEIPVMIEIIPARFGFADSEEAKHRADTRLRAMIESGLAARIMTGSYLTGSKYIELQFSNRQSAQIKRFDNFVVIPTSGSQFGHILAQVESILGKVNELPLDDVAANTNRILVAGTDALTEISKSAAELEVLLSDAEGEELVESLNTFLEAFGKLATDFSAGSPNYQEILGTLQILQESLKELEPVLDRIRRQPNSLIFGADEASDIEPKAAKPEGSNP